MPRVLFEPVATSAPKNRRPIGTLGVSILLHAAALVTMASLQIASAFDMPVMPAQLLAHVPPPPPPAPPMRPRSAPPSRQLSPVTSAAPTVAAERITPEPEALTATSGVPNASATFTVGPYDPRSLLRGGPPVTLAAPPEQPRGPVRVGGDIRPPVRTVYVTPNYPLFARTARIEGDVVLEATLDQAGLVTNVTIKRSIPALDRAAVEAVSKWRYQPTRLNGLPVAIVMEVTVSFRLR